VLLLLTATPLAWFASKEEQSASWIQQLERVLTAAWPPILLVLAAWIALRWWTTRYTVYERRVEVRAGVLFRRQRGIWLYDVDRPVYSESNPWQSLTGTGTIVIESEKLPARSLGFFFQYQRAGSWGDLRLTGFGTRSKVEEYTSYLTHQILRTRRAMKDRFV
jgi:hypothetical protein